MLLGETVVLLIVHQFIYLHDIWVLNLLEHIYLVLEQVLEVVLLAELLLAYNLEGTICASFPVHAKSDLTGAATTQYLANHVMVPDALCLLQFKNYFNIPVMLWRHFRRFRTIKLL